MTGFISDGLCVCVYLVLLVLPGVGEAGDDGGDAGRGGNLAGVDHDEQLHKVVVNFAAAALHDVHILAAHALPDLHAVWTTEKGNTAALGVGLKQRFQADGKLLLADFDCLTPQH